MWERPRIIAKGNDGGWVQRSRSEGKQVGGAGSVAGVDLLRYPLVNETFTMSRLYSFQTHTEGTCRLRSIPEDRKPPRVNCTMCLAPEM